MIDTSTGERLQVSTEAESGPYLDLPLSLVDEVCKRLDQEGITYWVDPDVIGIDLGITLLSAENLRSGAVWRWFMANAEIPNAMREVGLRP